MNDMFEELRDYEEPAKYDPKEWEKVSGRLDRRDRRRAIVLWSTVIGLLLVSSTLLYTVWQDSTTTQLANHPSFVKSPQQKKTENKGPGPKANQGSQTATEQVEQSANSKSATSSMSTSSRSASDIGSSGSFKASGQHQHTSKTQFNMAWTPSQKKASVNLTSEILPLPYVKVPNGLILQSGESLLATRKTLSVPNERFQPPLTKEWSLLTRVHLSAMNGLEPGTFVQGAAADLEAQYLFKPPIGLSLAAGFGAEFGHQLHYEYSYDEVFLTRVTQTVEYTASHVNYFTLNPQVFVEPHPKHYVGLGLYGHFLYQSLGSKQSNETADAPPTWGYDVLMARREFGLSATYGYRINPYWELGAALNYGLTNRLNAVYFPNSGGVYRKSLHLTLAKKIR